MRLILLQTVKNWIKLELFYLPTIYIYLYVNVIMYIFLAHKLCIYLRFRVICIIERISI